MASNLPVPVSRLPELTHSEVASLRMEERRAEVWLMRATGHTQAEIAKKLGVTRATVQKDVAAEARSRLSRLENSEEELEHIIGTLEAVVQESWHSHRNAPTNSLAGSNYLRLVLDAAREIARLRGFDSVASRRGDTGPTRAEIVVKIGGSRDFEPAIVVGAQLVGGGV